MRDLMLVDLSSILYPIYAMSASEPDPNHCSQATVSRVHALASGHPNVAICCDSGRSFRADIDSSYKANRPVKEEALVHQGRLAREALAADGFPVWAVPGFEADDVIATATARALELPDTTVIIVTGDKDLLQLVGPRVRVKSVRDGNVMEAAGVVEKFGVNPDQMRDYLTLVGDSSDNVKGATGIGPKKAQALLAKFRTLDDLYRDLAELGAGQMGLQPGTAQALREFQPRLEVTRRLIALRADAPIPFDEVLRERVSQAAVDFAAEETEQDEPEPVAAAQQPHVVVDDPKPERAASPVHGVQETALVVRESDEPAPAPAEWERQLDPRSMREAQTLANHMFNSRMFSAYGTPQAVLSTVMVGRELGLPAMASLRGVHIIEGKHSLSAALMVALVLKSGLAEYFEPVSISDTEVTFETHRKGARNPVRLTHTIEMARQAWSKTDDAWAKSGWGRNPTDMLVARASARLARLVYPDLIAGLYTPDELVEIRESREVAA